MLSIRLIFIVLLFSKFGYSQYSFVKLYIEKQWKEAIFRDFKSLYKTTPYNNHKYKYYCSWANFKLKAEVISIPKYKLGLKLKDYKAGDTIFNELQISNDYKVNLSFAVALNELWQISSGDIKDSEIISCTFLKNENQDEICNELYASRVVECYYVIKELKPEFIFSIKYIKGVFYIKDEKLFSLYLGQSTDAYDFIKSNYGDEKGIEYLRSIVGK